MSNASAPFLHTLYINLARRPDRDDRIRGELASAGLIGVERVKAVDLRGDEAVAVRLAQSLSGDVELGDIQRRLGHGRGMVAIRFSHIRALEHAQHHLAAKIQQQQPTPSAYLVVEDDLVLSDAPRFLEQVRAAMDYFPRTDWDIIRLDCWDAPWTGNCLLNGSKYPVGRGNEVFRTYCDKGYPYRSDAWGERACIDPQKNQSEPERCWYAGGAHAVLYRADAVSGVLWRMRREMWIHYDMLLCTPHLRSFCVNRHLVSVRANDISNREDS